MIPKVYSQNMLNLQFCIKQNLQTNSWICKQSTFRITLNQFQRRAKNFLTTQEEDLLGKPKDVGQVMKKNPGFDPVFMKVWNILVAMENWKIVMFADFET